MRQRSFDIRLFGILLITITPRLVPLKNTSVNGSTGLRSTSQPPLAAET